MDILFRPVIKRDSGFDYSTLSELDESEFKALYVAYLHITDVTPPYNDKITLRDFLKAISHEADNRGYFD